MHSGLSVVIPNYNGRSLFPDTIPTVFAALAEIDMPFEIIVADDCSTDDSLAFLQAHYPGIRIIKSDANRGFSVNANRGIHAANYDLVFLLNSDVQLDKNYFQNQFQYFDAPGTFGVMGRIMRWEDDLIQDAAKFPVFHLGKVNTRNYIPDLKSMPGGIFTMYVSGANALFDKKKFLELGGFNQIFSPFYVEDFDLSLRAWRLGWKCFYEHRSVCRHKTAASIKSKTRKEAIRTISIRNKMIFHLIHLSFLGRIIYLAQTIPEVLVQSVIGKTYYLKAFRQTIQRWEKIAEARRRLKQIAKGKRLLSLKQVVRMIRQPVRHKNIRLFKQPVPNETS